MAAQAVMLLHSSQVSQVATLDAAAAAWAREALVLLHEAGEHGALKTPSSGAAKRNGLS